MEPLPGITALAALFERAQGARLDAAERFAVSLPQLFPTALVGCDLAWQARAGIVVIVMRFAQAKFTADERRRLDFWLARAGVRCTDLAKVSPSQRASFFANLERCDVKHTGASPDGLRAAASDLFTAAGAPAGRRKPEGGPVLVMDVGGPGWEGVRYVPEERLLFLPGLVAPPCGDELTLSLRVPGQDRPLEARARVAWLRGPESSGAPAGFSLALVDAPDELVAALEARQPKPVSLAEAALRVHPRYAVSAPVVVAQGEGADGATATIEYASDQELAADYLENLSQGGAFVRTSHPAPQGTQLRLSMKLPGGDELSAPAVVVMTSDKGMGVRFELDEEGEARLAAAIARISARARRALVVDDDAVVRRMLQEALQGRGFEVLTAEDGTSGLSMLSEELLALDLLVTDLNMPQMDGEAFIRTIRRAGGEADLAIVAITGTIEGEVEKRLHREGADAVLDKALGPELIAQAADAVLERKRMARG